MAFLIAAAPRALGAEVGAAAAGPDSTWLPPPEEDLETLEPLEEEHAVVHAGALLRGSVAGGRFRMRRVGLQGRRLGLAAEAGILLDGARVRPGARLVAERGRVSIAGGRVSLARLPPLLAGAMRLTRAGRRVPAPRWGGISAGPSLGVSAGAIDGAAVSFGGRASVWSFAGTRGDGSGEPLGGVGVGITGGGTRVSAALGAIAPAARARTSRPAGRFGSVTVVRRERGRVVALEALGGTEGRALLADLEERAEAVLFSARWRYLSWEERNVAAELSAETLGSESRARLTWRSWSNGAEADDGVLELETAGSPGGVAPVKIRLGAAGLGGRGMRAPRDAYGLVEATVARDSGRSLSVHAVRRGSAAGGATASSTTVGTRLDWSAGSIGDHSLLIESTRIRRGAPAWGVALSPSGDVTLRARSKPGLWVTARGGLGAGPWHLGYALERGEDAAGPKPWSGSVWLRRNSD
ncbi:MAG TPA: hypothetical protein VEU09_01380 [Candidatus Binatia bacterium]|nr:hypothetical protein [Candidatus Binatia bacterium]